MGYRKNRKSANLIIQGGILSITLLIANLCTLFRQIPLTAIWGNEGNSMYSAAYEIYTLAWLLTSYAVPYAVSYLLKPRLKQGQYKNAGKILKTAFLYATITGGVLGGLLFFGSGYLMREIMLEPVAELALQILSATILLSAWNSILRGFFIGNSAGFPVVLSILIEQLCTLAAGLFLAGLLSEYGFKVGALLQNTAFQRSFAVAGFAAGICIGNLVSLIFLLVLYLLTHSYYKRKNGKDSGKGRESMALSVHIFVVCLFPMVVYGIFMRGYFLVQQLLFRQCMKDGLSTAVISQQWGDYFGKYKIISALPLILAIAMSASLRDKIHSFYKRGDYQHMREQLQTVLKAVMTTVIPLAVMIGVLAEPMLGAFFKGQDIERGCNLLLTGFVTAIFYSAAYLLAEVLWGMRKSGFLMLCGMAAFALQAGILYVMLEILHLDIFGVLYADLIYAFSLMLFLGIVVQKQCRLRYGFLKGNIPSVIAAGVMGVVLFLLVKALTGTILAVGLTILLLVLGLFIYFLLLLLLHGVTERELNLIPGGKGIAAIARAVRLL